MPSVGVTGAGKVVGGHMIVYSPSVCKLVLHDMLELEICRLKCLTLLNLKVTKCPLLDEMEMRKPMPFAWMGLVLNLGCELCLSLYRFFSSVDLTRYSRIYFVVSASVDLLYRIRFISLI